MFSCDAAVSGIKPAEDGSGDIILRLFDERSQARDVVINLQQPVKSASLCSITEKPISAIPVTNGKLQVSLPKNGVVTVRISL